MRESDRERSEKEATCRRRELRFVPSKLIKIIRMRVREKGRMKDGWAFPLAIARGKLIPGIAVMKVHQGTVTTIGAVIPKTVIGNQCPT